MEMIKGLFVLGMIFFLPKFCFSQEYKVSHPFNLEDAILKLYDKDESKFYKDENLEKLWLGSNEYILFKELSSANDTIVINHSFTFSLNKKQGVVFNIKRDKDSVCWFYVKVEDEWIKDDRINLGIPDVVCSVKSEWLNLLFLDKFPDKKEITEAWIKSRGVYNTFNISKLASELKSDPKKYSKILY